MGQEIYLRKIVHETAGEVYQFLKLDEITGQEQVLDPFKALMFKETVPEPQPELLYIRSKRGADASGYYSGDRFIVQKGWKFAASTSPKCPKKYIRHREELILSKLLVPLHKGLLVMEDIEFESPMAAMGAAIGGWVRGAHDWKEQGKK